MFPNLISLIKKRPQLELNLCVADKKELLHIQAEWFAAPELKKNIFRLSYASEKSLPGNLSLQLLFIVKESQISRLQPTVVSNVLPQSVSVERFLKTWSKILLKPAVDLCVTKTQVIVLINLGENITMELEMLKGLMIRYWWDCNKLRVEIMIDLTRH